MSSTPPPLDAGARSGLVPPPDAAPEAASLADWRRAAERTLKGKPLASVAWTTEDGIDVPLVMDPPPATGTLAPRRARICVSVDVEEPIADALALGFDIVRVHCDPEEDGDVLAALPPDRALVDPGRILDAAAALQATPASVLVGETWASDDASPAQQIGWALSTLLDAAIEADDDVSRLVIEVPVGVEVVTEIAKLRALRLAWPGVAAERDVSGELRILASGPSFPMTGFDCESNLLRATLAGFAALCGGADVVELAPYRGDDDRIREACRLAANQLLLMRDESRVDAVGDPWSGAHVVEYLTAALLDAGLAEFHRLRAAGGHLAADRDGDFDAMDAIQEPYSATETERASALAHRRRTVVGLNRFADPSRDADALLADDPEASFEFADVEGLDLGLAPGGGLLEYEWLRERMLWHEEAGHDRPTALLLPLGPRGLRRARADFAADFFRCGGFAIDDPQGFDDVDAAVSHARSTAAPVVVVCSDDASYGTLVPPIVAALPDARIYVAGKPNNAPGTEGATGHVFEGVNALAVLVDAQDALGIRRLP